MLSRSLLASDAPAVGYTVKTVPNYYRHLSLVFETTIPAEKLVPPLSTSPDNKHSLPPCPPAQCSLERRRRPCNNENQRGAQRDIVGIVGLYDFLFYFLKARAPRHFLLC